MRYPACRTCLTNYVKRGARCIYTRRVRTVFVFVPQYSWFSTSNTPAQNEANALLRLNFILLAILRAAGSTNPNQIACSSLTASSISTDTEVSAQPTDDFTTFQTNYLNNVNSGNTVDGMTVVSSSSTVSDTTTTTSDDNSANLGLILGVSIPLVILRTCVAIQWWSSWSSSRSTQARKTTPTGALRTTARSRCMMDNSDTYFIFTIIHTNTPTTQRRNALLANAFPNCPAELTLFKVRVVAWDGLRLVVL